VGGLVGIGEEWESFDGSVSVALGNPVAVLLNKGWNGVKVGVAGSLIAVCDSEIESGFAGAICPQEETTKQVNTSNLHQARLFILYRLPGK
jgi:hypothetical protein